MNNLSGLLLAFMFFLSFSSISTPTLAQSGRETATASVKIGRHQDFVRIVISSEDEYIQKASAAIADTNTIRVDFPATVVVETSQKVLLKGDVSTELARGFKAVLKGSSLIITAEGLENIKVVRLSSPSRLVIDAYVSKHKESISERHAAAISPEKSAFPLESFVIDAGHGGYDKGLHTGGFTEKEIALTFAKDLMSALGRKNKKVILTRKGDHALSIRERIKIANQRAPDIFLSIHISSKNELVVYTSAGKALKRNGTEGSIAALIAGNVKEEFGINVRQEILPLPLLTQVNVPALLIELPNPENFTYDKRNRERLIAAVLKAAAR